VTLRPCSAGLGPLIGRIGDRLVYLSRPRRPTTRVPGHLSHTETAIQEDATVRGDWEREYVDYVSARLNALHRQAYLLTGDSLRNMIAN